MSEKENKKLKIRLQKVGLPPGTLKKHPKAPLQGVKISAFQYNAEALKEKEVRNLKEVSTPTDKVTWINIDGIHDIHTLENAGALFNIHPLMLEDISSPDQRPKADEYDGHLFVTLRMLEFKNEESDVDSEQVSFVLGENYLLSFQERVGDVFNPNRERLRGGKGRGRSRGADYLFYTLIDTVVDHYFYILENLGEKIDTMELQLIQDPQEHNLQEIYKLKSEIRFVKKSIWPLREVISKLIREENPLIGKETRVYLKDVYDHCIQVMDTIESYSDQLGSMMDLYLNNVSHRLNEVMKVLTVISTIFIPLTFVTGLYGMNFEHMPELKYKAAYPIVLLIMATIIGMQLYYFKKKGWL